MRLAQRWMLPPRSRTAMLVAADLAGQVLVTPYNLLNKRHRCQTARGLAVVVPGKRFSIEVANLSDEPVCLRKGTIIATVSPVDDVDCLLVTDDAASPAAAAEAVLDLVDLSGVPDRLLPDVEALIRRHAYMLDGTLGSIDATVHREEIQPGTKPIRQRRTARVTMPVTCSVTRSTGCWKPRSSDHAPVNGPALSLSSPRKTGRHQGLMNLPNL